MHLPRIRMSSVTRARAINAALVIGGALAVIAVSVLSPDLLLDFGVLEMGLVVVPVVFLAFLAVLALFLVPVHTIPALALIVFALLPSRLLPQEGPLAAIPLTTAIFVVWGLRRLVRMSDPASTAVLGASTSGTGAWPERNPYRTAAIVSGILLVVWSAFALVRSVDVQTSAGWLISFTAGALLPLVIGFSPREARLVQRAWLFLGGWLGAYALGEAVIRTNPLWGTLYSVLGVETDQHWSTYRSEASFGHPLFAALFFAVACALGIGSWLTTRDRWTLLAAVFSGLGLVATVSRGALLGAAIALTFTYAAAMIVRGEKRWSRFALLGGLAVVAVIGLLQFQALSDRADSAEAQLSNQARELAAWVTLKAAESTGWLGSGPGTSGITGRLFDDVVIENSLFQLLISVGIPGLLLFACVIGFSFLAALRERSVGAAGALMAYTVCIAGFNALDALRPLHLLLGCLLILALSSRGGRFERDADDDLPQSSVAARASGEAPHLPVTSR